MYNETNPFPVTQEEYLVNKRIAKKNVIAGSILGVLSALSLAANLTIGYVLYDLLTPPEPPKENQKTLVG
ncbi:hypothetical protein VB638_05410 [Dolichospermum sp. UHCC 0684]|uniref:hypothetical protein n=1 Tax=unclassified Dolichospermum TaxID=2622029 RepID=UPI00144664CA|nr:MULTISPECIES: hypothetical protein [unclassified Dolichospermum]MEA5529032.1 hypothetical protein [Dolichospermum sp. UHCC 0684]MTJ34017.1 hypothetical protein [Dolichospermum sp. UHCC 0260]